MKMGNKYKYKYKWLALIFVVNVYFMYFMVQDLLSSLNFIFICILWSIGIFFLRREKPF